MSASGKREVPAEENPTVVLIMFCNLYLKMSEKGKSEKSRSSLLLRCILVSYELLDVALEAVVVAFRHFHHFSRLLPLIFHSLQLFSQP